ncbi:MAG TPA: hypothetical protein VF183_05250 [Acidimicrobiales bacterium]
MSTRSPDHVGAHVSRLLELADQVDFVERLDLAGRMIDRRRRELLGRAATAPTRPQSRPERPIGREGDTNSEEGGTTT